MTQRFREYENTRLGLVLQYPSSWAVNAENGDIIISSRPFDHGEMGANPCIHVQVQANAPRQSLAEFAAESKKELFMRTRDIDATDIRITGGRPAKCFKYTTEVGPDKAIKVQQIFTQVGWLIYAFTYVSPANEFYQWAAEIEECFKNVKISIIPLETFCLRKFVNTKYRYSLMVPISWKSESNNSTEPVVQFHDEGVMLIIAVDSLPSGTSLEKFTKIIESQIRDSDPKLPLNIQDTQLAKLPAKKTSYRSKSMTVRGKYFQVWAVKDGISCVITLIFQNAVEDAQLIANYEEQFDKIVESFEVHASNPKPDKCNHYLNTRAKVAMEFPEHFKTVELLSTEMITFSMPIEQNFLMPEIPVHMMIRYVYNATTLPKPEDTLREQPTFKESVVTVGGIEGKEYICDVEFEGIGKMHTLQRLVFNSITKVAITMTCAGPKTKVEEFRMACQFLNSFRFL